MSSSCVVGVEQVDELADLPGVHAFEELAAVLLVEFHEDVGLLLGVLDEVEGPLGLPQVEALEELGDVGGVEVVEFRAGLSLRAVVDELLYPLYVVVGEFLHLALGSWGSRRARMSPQLSPAVMARSSIQTSPTGLPMNSWWYFTP